jgi:hypothetical protein
MRTFLRILAWNVALVGALVGVAALAASAGAESAVFAVPGILALWVLFQGGMFATARWAVLTCAALSAILFLLQAALLAFFIFWNRGFDSTYPANALQLLIGLVLLGGALAVGAFLRIKRPAPA